MASYDYDALCAALVARDGRSCRVRAILQERRPTLPSGLLTCDSVLPLEPHHLVPKQRIKRAYETAARQQDPRLALHPLADVLGDPRLCILVDRRHHDLLERRLIRLFRDDLPDGCVEFAEELGLGWSIDRDYARAP